MMRKRFLDDLERIERGEDPKAIVRDPLQNVCIEMPIVEPRDSTPKGCRSTRCSADPAIDPRRDYRFQVGQPEAVRRAYCEAMGIDPNEIESGGGEDVIASAAAKTSRRIWT